MDTFQEELPLIPSTKTDLFGRMNEILFLEGVFQIIQIYLI